MENVTTFEDYLKESVVDESEMEIDNKPSDENVKEQPKPHVAEPKPAESDR